MNLFSKSKEKEEELDPFVEISYGAFHFKGDVRMLLPSMKEVKESVIPLMEDASRKAGLFPNQVAHDENVEAGYQ